MRLLWLWRCEPARWPAFWAQRHRPKSAARMIGSRSALDDSHDGPDVLESVRGAIWPGTHEDQSARRGENDPVHRFRHHDGNSDNGLNRAAPGRLGDRQLARNRCVLTRVRSGGILFCVFFGTRRSALARVSSIAAPLDAGNAVAIIANHHASREDGVGQPEPNQAEPHNHRMGEWVLHFRPGNWERVYRTCKGRIVSWFGRHAVGPKPTHAPGSHSSAPQDGEPRLTASLAALNSAKAQEHRDFAPGAVFFIGAGPGLAAAPARPFLECLDQKP